MNKIPKTRFFILEPFFKKRRAKFLAGLKFVGKLDARSTLNIVRHEENVYEFELKDKTIKITRDGFILPAYRLQKRGVIFDQHEFFKDNFVPEKIKKYLTPPRNRAKYGYQEQKRIDDFFITKAEKDIKNYFKKHDQLYLFDESYFLYDRSNIVKQSFVNKINKFLPLYSSAS